MRAYLKNYRQSPRKVRLVADIIRGKKVSNAEALLSFTTKRAAKPLKKLLNSAVANTKHNFNVDKENLYIKEVKVDKGVTLKRYRPRAMGRASAINKRTSHITILLAEREEGKSQIPSTSGRTSTAGQAKSQTTLKSQIPKAKV